MRRWNGWGDEATSSHLPASAADYLTRHVGQVEPAPDATLEHVLSSVPASRLPPHPLISTEPLKRVFHARGQSIPDWIAMRSGEVGVFPDGVAYPETDDHVRQLLQLARQTGIHLIPYGGGTSVLGHINPNPDSPPVLTIDMSRFNQLSAFDEQSHLAEIGAGASGPQIESILNPLGYTLGHFPQSWELSTLGGWIATRSAGQQSYHYGRIEPLFRGGHVETHAGGWDLLPFPASAAGPDLRELVLGSEGRFGIITRATVHIRRIADREVFNAAFFSTWEQGAEALKAIVRSRIPVSMLRLSDAQETETTLALAGKDRLVSFAYGGLRLAGYGERPCMLLYGLTGDAPVVEFGRRRSAAIIRRNGGFLTGTAIGNMWKKTRFTTPYLRNTLWEAGYAVETLETAMPWSSVFETSQALVDAIQQAAARHNENPIVYVHLSHIYPTGASIYITFVFRRGSDPGATLERWQDMKTAASRTIVEKQATISHQHGVGRDHADYLSAEKGEIGTNLLNSIQKHMDLLEVLNPGKLLCSK
ncbi:MAG: FAD-binding oxidoreductase [Anaerolineales bacterium]|nr:FAD-binding oxidoreductase [Anaerolineales bacterium]